MNLFFDEDNGTGIPQGIHRVRMPSDTIHYPSDKNHQIIKRGTPDKDWIPVVGHEGWLVFSQNKRMLHNEEERLLLIQHNVGAVFLASGNDLAFPVMRMLMNRWDWLQLIDATVPRPFAYLITIGGNARKLDIYSSLPLGSGVRAPGVKVSTKVSTPHESGSLMPLAETSHPAIDRLPGF